jgi:undecaprenyl-diphosphatase
MIGLLQIVLLGLIQGAAELLPVSSSAHVIVAEKLMGIDPTSPEATFLLVMLHTGTMFAVLVYFWKKWAARYFAGTGRRNAVLVQLVIATACTGAVGLGLKILIEKMVLGSSAGPGEVEDLFGNLPLIAFGLAAAGFLIVMSGLKRRNGAGGSEVSMGSAVGMGLIQGLILPFRGFSRSGSTISAGLLAGNGRAEAEDFSFALAVLLTPAVLALEFKRLLKLHAAETQPHHLLHLAGPGLIGMACSFVAGLLALRLLSQWLEKGRWHYFGYYCLAAAAAVAALAAAGF